MKITAAGETLMVKNARKDKDLEEEHTLTYMNYNYWLSK